jgi:adenylate cyclase
VAGRHRIPKGGDKRHLTALTFGIRNFSAVCDELPPDKLIDFMRAYRREVFSYLGSEDAHVSGIGNDLFLAVFGSPIPHADHARRACRAALELRRRIAKKKSSWQQKYRMSPFRLAVGIDTSPLVVGEIGSRGRHAYATIGHAVQMCEVFAQLCRTYRTSIVVGAEAVQATREWYAYRPLDHIRVRKTKRSIEIFELLGKKGVVTPYIDLYMRAYDAYRLRIYEDTIKYADQLLAKLPHDGPSLLLKARAQRFMKNPPAEEWDGAWIVQ